MSGKININAWQPMDDFAIRLSDETAEDRTEEELDQMVEEMREIANKYDFDLEASGSWQSFKHMVVGEMSQRIVYDFHDQLDSQRKADLKEREEG